MSTAATTTMSSRPAAIAPDNIPPATGSGPAYTGFKQYGFRVPCAVVSPYARRDYVSHTVFDHTSILALLETKWNMPALTLRDANAHNMLDLLDLGSPPSRRRPRWPGRWWTPIPVPCCAP